MERNLSNKTLFCKKYFFQRKNEFAGKFQKIKIIFLQLKKYLEKLQSTLTKKRGNSFFLIFFISSIFRKTCKKKSRQKFTFVKTNLEPKE